MLATHHARVTTLPRSAAAFKLSVPLRDRYDNWIAGEYVAPAGGRYFTNLTPITGAPLCEVARSTHEDVDRALDAAHAAAISWNSSSPAYRATILNRIADRMEANLETLAVIETLSAKMRIFRAPEFLGTAFLLAVLAMLVNLLLGS